MNNGANSQSQQRFETNNTQGDSMTSFPQLNSTGPQMTNRKGSMHNQEQEPTIAVSTKLGTEAIDDKETHITLNKGYPNEVEAEKYATKIANNVVHKLKMTLGIANEETSTKQLQSFFQQKFRANNDGIYPPLVDDPRLEILNRNVFGPTETEEEKQKKLSKEAKLIREQMIGFADAIITRQDKSDVLRKVESIEMERSARKVLSEILTHFTTQEVKNKKEIDLCKSVQEKNTSKIDIQHSLIGKLQAAFTDLPNLKTAIAQERQKIDSLKQQVNKLEDSTKSKSERLKTEVMQKVERMREIELKIRDCNELNKKTQELALDIKKTIYAKWAEKDKEMISQKEAIKAYETRLNSNITDCKFWLEKYTETFKEHEANVKGIKMELHGRMDTVLRELDKLVSVNDMRLNMDGLSDMLFVKFRQLEDVKTCARDLIAYTKHFLPAQVQAMIGENIEHLAAAKKDGAYQSFQSKKYKEMANEIELHRRMAKKCKDIELVQHYRELDRYDLNATEWKLTPLDKPDNDYVKPLLIRYLEDLTKRQQMALFQEDNVANACRKSMQLTDLDSLMNNQWEQMSRLTKSKEELQAEITHKNDTEAHDKRMALLINQRLKFKKKRALKRSNSHIPGLPDFGTMEDIDDIDADRRMLTRSKQGDREDANALIGDETDRRLVRNLQHPETDSELFDDEEENVEEEDQFETKGEPVVVGVTNPEVVIGYNPYMAGNNPAQHNFSPAPDQNGSPQLIGASTMSGFGAHQPPMQTAPVTVTEEGVVKIITLEEAKEIQEKNPDHDQKMISFYSTKQQSQQQELMRQSMRQSVGQSQNQEEGQIFGARHQSQDYSAGTAMIDPQKEFGVKRGSTKVSSKKPMKLDREDKKQIIQDVKVEMKPVVSQLCELQIQKANHILKTELRKIDSDLGHNFTRLTQKIERDVKQARAEAEENSAQLLARIEVEMNVMNKKLSRDRSDNDKRANQHLEVMNRISEQLSVHSGYMHTLAVVESTLIENVNMQMEAETADMIDRRMMQLFAVAHKKLDKASVQNANENLTAYQSDNQSPMGQKLLERINTKGIPELGLHGKSVKQIDLSTLPALHKKLEMANMTDPEGIARSPEEQAQIVQAAAELYQDKTTLAQETLRKEYSIAYETLKNTGKLPITIDNNCLSCMSSGRDTNLILNMFKTACLQYTPTNVAYREHSISRTALVGMRRDLFDNIIPIIQNCELFSKKSIFPRRYFDDLVIEQQMARQQMKNEETIAKVQTGSIDQARLHEVLNAPRSSELPFHGVTGKVFKQPEIQSNPKHFSTFSSLSPRVSQVKTTHPAEYGPSYADILASTTNSHSTISVHDQLSRQKAEAQELSATASQPGQQHRNSLDVSSEAELSKVSLRGKLQGESGLRQFRNRTLDGMCNSLQDLPTVQRILPKDGATGKSKPKKFKLMLHTNTSNVQFMNNDSSKALGITSSTTKAAPTGKYTNLTQRSEQKRLRAAATGKGHEATLQTLTTQGTSRGPAQHFSNEKFTKLLNQPSYLINSASKNGFASPAHSVDSGRDPVNIRINTSLPSINH